MRLDESRREGKSERRSSVPLLLWFGVVRGEGGREECTWTPGVAVVVAAAVGYEIRGE
jgi:hypothetical protein